MDDFFSGWFHGAPAASIKRGNVTEFISYGFYCKRLEALDDGERADVDQYVLRLESKRGRPFEPGTNPAAVFRATMSLTGPAFPPKTCRASSALCSGP